MERSCVVCGGPYNSDYSQSRYCREACAHRAKRRRQAGLPEADSTTLCVVCETPFTSRPDKRTCSEPCAQRRRWRLNRNYPVADRDQPERPRPRDVSYARVCERCGTEFHARVAHARFCSTWCQRNRKRRRSLDEWLAMVDRSGDGCHLWPDEAPVASHGYPYSRNHELTGERYVHRILYIRRYGPIPEGWEPDHTCREKRCVREDHHELVTHVENLRRAVPHRNQQRHRLGRCPHADEDIYRDPTGKRVCRICRRERTRQWRAEQRNMDR